MAILSFLSTICVILHAVISAAGEDNPTVLKDISLANLSYSTSKPSSESVVLNPLTNLIISQMIDFGVVGWAKMGDDSMPDTQLATLQLWSTSILSNADSSVQLPSLGVFASYNKANGQIDFNCGQISQINSPVIVSFAKSIQMRKWFFFSCSYSVALNSVQAYLFNGQDYRNQQPLIFTSSQKLLQFGNAFNLTISKPTTSSTDLGWYGEINAFKLAINVKFDVLINSKLQNLLFGEVELLYFLPLDSRNGQLALEEINNSTFSLAKSPSISTPSFVSDGAGLSFSSQQQAALLKYIQLDTSLTISLWFLPHLSGQLKQDKQRILTITEEGDLNQFSFQIADNQLRLKVQDKQTLEVLFGNITDSTWHFLSVSILSLNNQLVIKSYLTNSFAFAETTQVLQTSSFAINSQKSLFNIYLGGLITQSGQSMSADESFFGTIKDLLIAKGGAVYQGTSRNSAQKCDLLLGFTQESQRCLVCNSQTIANYKVSSIFNACGSACQNGQYPYRKTRNCEYCDPKCKECFGGLDSQCRICNLGFFKLKTICYEVCPTGYYSDSLKMECRECDSTCKECSGPENTSCLSCQNGFYKNKNICSACSSSCSSCFGGKNTECAACSANYFIYGTSCLSSCPDFTFQNTSTRSCQDCSPICQTCEGAKDNCLSCPEKMFLALDTTQTCKPCFSFCSSCFGLSQDQCITCEAGYYQDGNSCVEVCPETKYRNQSGDYLYCESCQSPCRSCFAKDICIDCVSGFFYNEALSTCIECSKQLNSCSECKVIQSLNQVSCTACSSGYLGLSQTPNILVCGETCSNGFFPDNPSLSCLKCNDACTVCTGPKVSQCQGCVKGFYLDSAVNTCKVCPDRCNSCALDNLGVLQCLSCLDTFVFIVSLTSAGNKQITCQASCSFGYFQQGFQPFQLYLSNSSSYSNNDIAISDLIANNIASTDLLRCSPCMWPCLSCSSSQSCSSCVSSYYLSGSSCLPCNSPPAIMCSQCYLQGNVKCTSCLSNSSGACLNYLKDSQCVSKIQCQSDKIHFADETQCVCSACNSSCKTCSGGMDTNCLSCNEGYFLSPANNSCQKCHFSCSTCSSFYQCLQCQPNYFLYSANTSGESNCVLSCPDTFVGENSICRPCADSNCKSCNTKDECQMCLPSFFKNGSLCEQCSSNCQECSAQQTASNNNCTKCHSGQKLFLTNCLGQCPQNTFENSDSTCISCDASCTACYGPGNAKCSSCQDGFYLDYPSTCKTCDISCRACSGPGQYNCLSCSKGYYLLGSSTCLRKCIDGYYPDANTWTCLPCNNYCGKCDSQDVCLSCKTGYYQSFSSPSEGVLCSKCHNSCSQCNSSLSTDCSQCNFGFFLFNSSCLLTCPEGYRPIDGLCIKCSDRHCAECNTNNISQCNVCLKGYVLDQQNNTCLNACPDGYYQAQTLDSTKIAADASNLSCQQCDEACSICFGPSSSECSACTNGYYFHSEYHSCSLSCQQGFILDSNSKASCEVCKTSCLSCIASQFQYSSTCFIDGCPFPTELIPKTNICQERLKPSIRMKSSSKDIQVLSDIVIEAEVSSQIAILNQIWKVRMPLDQVDSLLKDCETQFSILVIPIENIVLGQEYVLELMVVNEYGSETEQFVFDSSMLIKIGQSEVTSSDGAFISGSSQLSLKLQGWKAPLGSILLFDIFLYQEINETTFQNGRNTMVSTMTRTKSVGSNLKQQTYNFKTLPLLFDGTMILEIRGFTSEKSITVRKYLQMSANQKYKQILIDQQTKATNQVEKTSFGADDNFFLNFFGTNLPSDTEDIVIQMEIAKQLLRNNTFIADAQYHEKNAFFQILKSCSLGDTVPQCEDQIDCLGQGICSIQEKRFYWSPKDTTSQEGGDLIYSYSKYSRQCTCNPQNGGIICDWDSKYYQNITQKVGEASAYVRQLPTQLLNPANILNLYSTMADYKDMLSTNFELICLNTENYLKIASGQPIYSHFIHEIVSNYLDVLINYNQNMDQSFIFTHVKLLYNLQQTYIDESIPYIKKGDSFKYFQNNIYSLVLAIIDQEILASQGFYSFRRQLSDTDLFEFGDGVDILLSLYSIPSISVEAAQTQVLVPFSILTSAGKIVIKVQNFQINPFDYLMNCTLISNNQISQFVQVQIFNQDILYPTVGLTSPITVVLKKLARFKAPSVVNVTSPAYTCMNYMETYKNWNSTHCHFQTENSTHISCSCYSLQGPIVVVAIPDNIQSGIAREDLLRINQFLHPTLLQERQNLLISLGLLPPPMNKTEIEDSQQLKDQLPSIFSVANLCGIYALLGFFFGAGSFFFLFALGKTQIDDQKFNTYPIIRPSLHFHPLYSFFRGPTNAFISNNSRAFLILSNLSANMSYAALATQRYQSNTPIIPQAFMVAFVSIGSSYILFGVPSFLKLGLNNNLAFKKIIRNQSIYQAFSYYSLIQVLSLLYIMVNQFVMMMTVGNFENDELIAQWLQCLGIAYLIENVVDLMYVGVAQMLGVESIVTKIIALRGYVLLSENLLQVKSLVEQDEEADGDEGGEGSGHEDLFDQEEAPTQYKKDPPKNSKLLAESQRSKYTEEAKKQDIEITKYKRHNSNEEEIELSSERKNNEEKAGDQSKERVKQK